MSDEPAAPSEAQDPKPKSDAGPGPDGGGESPSAVEATPAPADSAAGTAAGSEDVAAAFAGKAPAAGDAGAEAPKPEPKKRKKKRKKPSGAGTPAPGGRLLVEDSIDQEAEQLARDARSVPHARMRPIAECSRQVRRLMASRSARDHREARRALVMLKSRVAYLAGREIGRERGAMNRIRDMVFKNVDQLVRNKDDVDRGALRNFLDHLDAFIGYHRFQSDDRRRDH